MRWWTDIWFGSLMRWWCWRWWRQMPTRMTEMATTVTTSTATISWWYNNYTAYPLPLAMWVYFGYMAAIETSEKVTREMSFSLTGVIVLNAYSWIAILQYDWATLAPETRNNSQCFSSLPSSFSSFLPQHVAILRVPTSLGYSLSLRT